MFTISQNAFCFFYSTQVNETFDNAILYFKKYQSEHFEH